MLLASEFNGSLSDAFIWLQTVDYVDHSERDPVEEKKLPPPLPR